MAQEKLTIVDILANDKSAFEEFHMGDIEEEDKQYIYVDPASKKVFDVRKDNEFLKMEDQKELVSFQH